MAMTCPAPAPELGERPLRPYTRWISAGGRPAGVALAVREAAPRPAVRGVSIGLAVPGAVWAVDAVTWLGSRWTAGSARHIRVAAPARRSVRTVKGISPPSAPSVPVAPAVPAVLREPPASCIALAGTLPAPTWSGYGPPAFRQCGDEPDGA